ncbi:MAG: hypothetical protein AAGD07_07125 [Planctomycetota bacterium]
MRHQDALVRSGERRATHQHVIQRAAERVDVGADISRRRVEGLFRRHVLGRAQHRAVGGQTHRFVLAGCLGQSKVEDLDLPLTVFLEHHHVGRLDVAVDHLAFVGVLERTGDLAGDRASRCDGYRAILGDELVQVHSRHVLHRKDQLSLQGNLLVCRGNRRVVQLADRPHFGDEALARRFPSDHLSVEDFQDFRTIHRQVLGQVHHPHPATAQFLQNLVIL